MQAGSYDNQAAGQHTQSPSHSVVVVVVSPQCYDDASSSSEKIVLVLSAPLSV